MMHNKAYLTMSGETRTTGPFIVERTSEDQLPVSNGDHYTPAVVVAETSSSPAASSYQSVPNPVSNPSSDIGWTEYPGTGVVTVGDTDINPKEHPNEKSLLIEIDTSLRENATSNNQTLMHLIKGNLGTGILALPLAFEQAGLWLGLGCILAIGFVALHCMHVLVHCSHVLCRRTGLATMDYADVAEYSFKTTHLRFAKFGNPAKKLVNALIMFTQFGFCCVYIVFISRSIDQVVGHYMYSPKLIVYEIIVTAVLIPFVYVRNLEHLAPFSLFANILTLTGLAIIFQFIMRDIPDTSERDAIGKPTNIPLFLGTAFFAIEGISLVLPLENTMREPESFNVWNGVLNLGMVTVICLYAAIGFYGYLKLGEGVEASITLSLPQGNWLYVSVKLMFAIAIFISYGVQFYVPIQIIWSTLKKKVKRPLLHKYGEYLLRTFFVLLTFGFAAAIPHLDLLISLIGAFSGVSLALILPSIIELVTYSGDDYGIPWWMYIKNIIILLLGLVGCVMGTYSSLRAIIETF